VSDEQYGRYIWQKLREQSSAWSHWNSNDNLNTENQALDKAYAHGGQTYVGGPICGTYAVCVSGVSFVTDDTAMTFGRVIITKEDDISVWKQFHEYGHVIDYVDVGAERFLQDYAWAKLTAVVHRGGDRPDDGNWTEKSANARADAAWSAWDAAGKSTNLEAGPSLLPDTVKDVFRTSNYSEQGAD
jgi:hypothetical protein